MSNPQVPGGTLNRLLASVQVVANPALNVTSGNLGPELISLTFEGATADYIENLTSATPSPRPYQIVTVTAHLLKSQSLSNVWEQQRTTNSVIGDIVVTPDASTLGDFYLSNCIIQNIEGLAFTGATNDYPLVLRGTYYINAALFV